MKILLINDYDALVGGAEVIVASLMFELRRRGHDVRLLSSSAYPASSKVIADYRGFGTTGRWRTLLQSANPFAARTLRHALKTFRPDIVHVNLYLTQLSPLILRELRHVPTIYYAQWYRAICPRGTKLLKNGCLCTSPVGTACLSKGCISWLDWPPLMMQMELARRWVGVFHRVVAISQAVAEKLDTFGDPPLKGATVIHPGTPLVAPRSPDEMTSEPTVVVAGRLVREKGVETLLRAFALVKAGRPDCRLIVIGDGPERAMLEKQTQELGLTANVQFTGHLPHAEVLTRIRQAWCVSVPSIWDEPFGMLAAETQMQGVAVIASRCGGLKEILLEGETGFLVEPGNCEQLAKHLQQLLSNRAEAIQLGIAGHAHAARYFNSETFAIRMEALYEAVIVDRDRMIRSQDQQRSRTGF